GGALAHVPALVGEAMAGGAVAGRIAGGVPGVAGWAARTGLTTAAMPSMWMDQWTQSNIAAGRDAANPLGLPPALAMGFMNTAVLGSLGGIGNSITTPGVRGAVARILARTATGMLEQQGIDLMASAVSEVLPKAWKLQTGYGLLGELARGARGE